MFKAFIPPFDGSLFWTLPWESTYRQDSLWIVIMGFLVSATCGLIGNFMVLRRMAMVGDAMSHSIVLGIVVAFLIAQSRATIPMFIGAILAGVLTSLLIEIIYKHSPLKSDAAIGIIFSSFFAIGIILMSIYADSIDLDQDCVLYGDIAFVSYAEDIHLGSVLLGPMPIVRMAAVFGIIFFLIILFYKELLVTTFDPGLALSLGLKPAFFHYGLMTLVSLAIVSGFESVGAILVIAMLIFPGVTGGLLSKRLPVICALSLMLSAIYAILGLHMAMWLNCSISGAIVVSASIIFVFIAIFRTGIRKVRNLL